jgi:transcriptional regulator of acetoin/glycerol metabolism
VGHDSTITSVLLGPRPEDDAAADLRPQLVMVAISDDPQAPSSRHLRFAPAALRAMMRHDWPLNIRELEKVLATAAVLATEGVIEAAHLPDTLRRARVEVGPATPSSDPAAAGEPPPPPLVDPAPPVGMRASDDELRQQLVDLLTVHEGNVLAVSKALHTRRTQVYRWLRRFAIDVEAFRRRPR